MFPELVNVIRIFNIKRAKASLPSGRHIPIQCKWSDILFSELSTSFPDKGPTVVQALVYKRGEKRRPEYLLKHAPYSAPLRYNNNIPTFGCAE